MLLHSFTHIHSHSLTFTHKHTCIALHFAQVVPFTLAENAGLNPISTVTDLRARHQEGSKSAGINVRKVRVLQHLASLRALLSLPAISFAQPHTHPLLPFIAVGHDHGHS